MDKGGSIDTVLSTVGDQGLTARLFDSNGVLLAESVAFDPTAGGRATKGSLTPQVRLQADGLTAGATYFIQLIPGANPTGTPAGGVKVGISGIGG